MSDVIAVLGFGEAGSLIARDLVAAGAIVRGFDPKVPAPAGVTGADSDAAAATGADLVLSVNSAGDAVAALTASLGALTPGVRWADLNTAAPGTKQRLAGIGQEHGIHVTDIAMMAPVPGRGLRVPMLASGDGADLVAATLRGYGAGIEVLDGPAGLAATRKLLRSVYYKGMAASIVEALEAARAAGLEDWLTEHIAEDLAKHDAAMLTRIVTGTRRHAVRRGHEMAAATEMLADLGVEPEMAAASQHLHERLARQPQQPLAEGSKLAIFAANDHNAENSGASRGETDLSRGSWGVVPALDPRPPARRQRQLPFTRCAPESRF